MNTWEQEPAASSERNVATASGENRPVYYKYLYGNYLLHHIYHNPNHLHR
jgi:hypothetical protein